MDVQLAQKALFEAESLLNSFANNKENLHQIAEATIVFAHTLQQGGKILSCGNGGSMCDAIHFAEELTGRFKNNRPALAAMAISDPGHISCVANDFGYDNIFSRTVEALGRENDALLAISTSGNSLNVINAVNIAKDKGMKIIALLGKDGGQLKDMADVALVIKSDQTARIQEVHIKLIHIFVEGIERILYPELYE